MDFDKIKTIRSYVKKIVKFKKLEKFKNMSEKEFEEEMKMIFPNFSKEYSKVFDLVVKNEDLGFLNLMFNKLKDIENEYDSRYNEGNVIRPIVKEMRKLLDENSEIKKNDLVKYIEQSDSNFIKKYPIIIDRILDKDYNKYDANELLLEQIKYNHEIIIGNELAKKYIYPKINK